ncbi:MAG: sugar ABC transporter permease [Tissierellia bacterium]|nr:sugar ABC transporter permease [Tissierellia bacterium]
MIKNKKIPWLLLAPTLLIIGILVLYPILRTFTFSLYQYQLNNPENITFIGFSNYKNILQSKEFYFALSNSGIMLLITLVLSIIGSLFVALLLNIQSPISPLLTGVAILPWALPPLVNGIIWMFIFNPGYGLLNKILVQIGILNQPFSWTAHRLHILFIVSLVVAWRVIPFCAILILTNLRNIPYELYEAARVDGSGSIQSFFRITLPLILPSLFIVFVQVTMASINTFDEIIAIAGYKFESQNLILHNYFHTFRYLNFGYGSAISYLIMILSGILGYFYVKSMSHTFHRKEVE